MEKVAKGGKKMSVEAAMIEKNEEASKTRKAIGRDREESVGAQTNFDCTRQKE